MGYRFGRLILIHNEEIRLESTHATLKFRVLVVCYASTAKLRCRYSDDNVLLAIAVTDNSPAPRLYGGIDERRAEMAAMSGLQGNYFLADPCRRTQKSEEISSSNCYQTQ